MIGISIINNSNRILSYPRIGLACLFIIFFSTLSTNPLFVVSAQVNEPFITAIPNKTSLPRGENLDVTISINDYVGSFPIELNVSMYNNGSIKYLPTLVLESVVYEKIISWKQLMAGGIFTININGTAEPFNTLLSTSFNITVTFPMESIVKINVYDSVEQIELELIDPKTIIWEASNIGGIVCNDVIVTRIAFVPPFETDAPWDEFDLGSIEPGKTKQWSVNAFATDYGVGMVTYQAEYITGDTWEEKVSLSYTLNIFAVPSLNVLIDYTDSGVVDDTMNLSISDVKDSNLVRKVKGKRAIKK